MFSPKRRLAGQSSLPWILLLLVSTGTVTIGTALLAAEKQAQPVAKVPELLKERLATIREMSRLVTQRFKSGEGSYEDLQETNRMLIEAELALCVSNKDRVAILEKCLLQAKDLEKITTQLSKTGQGRASVALMAKANRLQAEIALERAKTKATGTATLEVQVEIDLADKKVAIKRALVKVAEAQKMTVASRLATMKSHIAEAQATETFANKQLSRIEELARQKAVDDRLVAEWRLKSNAAKARRASVEGKLAECQSQVLLEQARIEVARLEAEDAELRLKQLRVKLEPKR